MRRILNRQPAWRILLALAVLASSPAVRGDETADQLAKKAEGKTAAQLLPAATVAYAEIARPKQLIDAVLNHRLRPRVESLDAYKAVRGSPDYLKFQLGLGVAQTALGMKWDEAVSAIAGGGIHIGFDPAAQGGVVLVRAEDAEKLAKTRDRLLGFVRGDAKDKKRPDPVKEIDHRGVATYQVGPAYAATIGPWLVASNKADALKGVIDRLADGGASLYENAEFRAARESLGGSRTAWAYVHVKSIRDYGLLAKALPEKSDNPGVEVLLGGLLATLGKTPYATASIDVNDSDARIVVAAPHQPAWVSKPREFYFGPGGKGRAPQPLVPADPTALSLVAHRDLAGMWLGAADLFDEKANAELSKADSGLSTLFGGKEFGREILGAFGPEMQVIVTRQDYSKATGTPEIKIPAGAIVLRMKEPAKTQQQLKVTFQSVIGFLNIVGGMNGYPPLDLNTERRGKDLIVSSEYMMEKDDQAKGGKMFHNFSPSIAIVGDRFIISSTKSLAESLTEAATKPTTGSADSTDTNTELKVTAAVAAKMLDDNRAQLVAQNMLEKGHDKKKAEAEIKTLTDIVTWFDSAALRLTTPKDRVELELSINFAHESK